MSVIRIPLSQGYSATIDEADFKRVSLFKWSVHKGSSNGARLYAATYPAIDGRRVWTRLHRFLFNMPPGSPECDLVVDHLDGDGLNCCRNNLEVVTREENQRRAHARKLARLKDEIFL